MCVTETRVLNRFRIKTRGKYNYSTCQQHLNKNSIRQHTHTYRSSRAQIHRTFLHTQTDTDREQNQPNQITQIPRHTNRVTTTQCVDDRDAHTKKKRSPNGKPLLNCLINYLPASLSSSNRQPRRT